ncbi:MAG: hypothetical protein ACRYF8_05295 [Janthinobacterium lividum]|jgi:hypothetical protein
MADNSLLNTIPVAILTAALTLLGTSLQQAHQDTRADSLRFLDGAHATIQETIIVLNDGYDALEKLVSTAETKGWNEFSDSDWTNYRNFHRNWRQALISQHFKITRYFGKDLADNLINLDELYRSKKTSKNDNGEVSPPYNLETLAYDLEFTTRLITVNQDIIDKSINEQNAEDVFEVMDEKRKNSDAARQMLGKYERASIMLIEELDSRLTQLGAANVRVVQINKK